MVIFKPKYNKYWPAVVFEPVFLLFGVWTGRYIAGISYIRPKE
jgi:hypothetical protein